jgi:hypothetical protein
MHYAVIRHPDVATPGVCPETSIEHHRGLGWRRVSAWTTEPDRLVLNDFGPDLPDLDLAPEPEPEPAADMPTRKPAKESA